MKRRLFYSMLLLAPLTAFAGCGGPTKAGLEARSDARERLAMVNAQVSYDQAERAFEVGQFDRALREVENALQRYPEESEYHLLHGRILLELHRLERAYKAFELAIEKDEESAEAHYFTGIVFQRWSDNDRAYEHYTTASELDESNAQYLLAAAESLIALRRYEDARELVEPQLAYFEHNTALHHLLAQIAMLQDDAERAAELFTKAQRLNPDDPMLLEELAWAQYAAGRYGHCHDTLQQLLPMGELDGSQRTDLLHLKARCLVFLDRHREARPIYMELTSTVPSDPEVWIELGALSWELKDMRRVASSASRIIALSPERFEGYLLRGVYAKERGELRDARRFFTQAAQCEDTESIAYLLLGQVLEQEGNTEAAERVFERAVELFPDSAEAKSLLAGVQRSLRDEGEHAAVPVR